MGGIFHRGADRGRGRGHGRSCGGKIRATFCIRLQVSDRECRTDNYFVYRFFLRLHAVYSSRLPSNTRSLPRPGLVDRLHARTELFRAPAGRRSVNANGRMTQAMLEIHPANMGEIMHCHWSITINIRCRMVCDTSPELMRSSRRAKNILCAHSTFYPRVYLGR